MPKIVFEHMEPDLSQWAKGGIRLGFLGLEYAAATKYIGAENVLFTNFSYGDFAEKLKVRYSERLTVDLLAPEKVCLLDSEASETLSPEDASKFDYFLVGGILGNVDEFDADRTRLLRANGYSARNMGGMQMTMDTAAIVCAKIVNEGQQFASLVFIDRPLIHINRHESVKMNFRYLANDGKPIISPEVLQIIKDTNDFDLNSLE